MSRLAGLSEVAIMRSKVAELRVELELATDMLQREEAGSPEAAAVLGRACLFCGVRAGMACTYASGRGMGGRVHGIRRGG